jgi:hypothetical protein
MSRLKAAIDRGKARMTRVTALVQVQDSSPDQSLVVFSRLLPICLGDHVDLALRRLYGSMFRPASVIYTSVTLNRPLAAFYPPLRGQNRIARTIAQTMPQPTQVMFG